MNNTLAAREHVLVVDDELSVCSVLVRVLSRDGFVALSASSGDEALNMLRQRDFAVVISDLKMPGISGLELLDQCRVEYPNLAFLIVTGEDDVHVGVEAMKRGADDYLVKPFQVHA